MLQHLSFKQYKAFAGNEVLEIRPITLLVGKNSSGKSSICKLFPLIQRAMSMSYEDILSLDNEGVILGSRFEDLFHNNQNFGLNFRLSYEEGIEVEVSYILNEGKLYVHSYSAKSGLESKVETYTSWAESKASLTHGFINERVLDSLRINPLSLAVPVDYVGPIRKPINRSLSFTGNTSVRNVGLEGENAGAILLHSYLNETRIFERVSAWMERYMEGQKLIIRRNGESSGSYSVCVDKGDVKVNIADVGQGITQLLPVILQTYLAESGSIEVIEQPVLHLHPAIHANVAVRFAEAALENRVRYVIESHSLNFLLGLRKMVADKSHLLQPKDVVVYFVDVDEESKVSSIDKIEILDNGELTRWPDGVFFESFDLMSDIVKGQQ